MQKLENAVKEAAKTMRKALQEIGCHDVSYSQCLEIASKQAGVTNWRTAKAVLAGQSVELPVSEKPLPRVLITVSGGIAEWYCDDGVLVEIFDWDNYNDEEDSCKILMAVSESFRDLAIPLDIPVHDSRIIAYELSTSPEHPDSGTQYTKILQHNIEWWLGGDDVPIELDNYSIEHIEKCIKDGFNQGELCVLGNDGNTEYRGWWSIKLA